MELTKERCFEPVSWLLVFHPNSTRAWVNRLVPGFYKHVSSVAWFESAQCWIFFDPGLERTQVLALSEDDGVDAYGRLAGPCGVMRVKVNRSAGPWRFGIFCVPQIKHLLGIRSGALRPDALWRHLAANGAEILADVRSKPVRRDVYADGGRTGCEGAGEG